MWDMKEVNAVEPNSHVWIDDAQIEWLLTDPIKVMCAVDGSDGAACGFEWVLQGLVQSDRKSQLIAVHIFDPNKDYLPPKYRSGAIKSKVESLCTAYLLPDRYHWMDRPRIKGQKVAAQICDIIEERQASFITMGFQGKPNRKDTHLVGSNVMEVMQRGRCSVIIFKTQSPEELPLKRANKFVVSVGPNKAASKAFLDAVRLSKPGDQIHVVYVRPFLENGNNEGQASKDLKLKYGEVIDILNGKGPSPRAQPAPPKLKSIGTTTLAGFGERAVELVFAPQGRTETVAQALNRYATNWGADFVLVGTNTLRVQRGKPVLGSVSLQICMEFEGNVVVSNYVDELKSRPGTSGRPGTTGRPRRPGTRGF